MKRVFIIHGWSGTPEEGWLPWLKRELESRGFEVFVPAMPHTENPTIDDWVGFLKDLVKNPDPNTYFVGHSIGCQTILRYLETLPNDKKVGGAVLVAGFCALKNLDVKEKEIAKPWLETPIDFEKVKAMAKSFTCIFSENDPYVPYQENKKIFKEKLNAKIVTEAAKGHFTEDDGITELPSALDALTEISS